MALKMKNTRAKSAAAPLSLPDHLSREFPNRPSSAAMKDAEDAARAALDPRINAIVPPLPLDQAQLLGHVLRAYEAQDNSGVRQGVDLAAGEIATVMGVNRDTATALRTALIGRGLLVQTRDTMMDGHGTIFRPGPLPTASAAA